MLTCSSPGPVGSSCSNAPQLRSTTRPVMYGPRSVTRASTERPVEVSSTRTRVPHGRLLWAIWTTWVWKTWPHAVRLPSKPSPSPYVEAMPDSYAGSGVGVRVGARVGTEVGWGLG